MKQIIFLFRILIMATCLFYCGIINAYDFEVNGIYYYITSSAYHEVAVGARTDGVFPAASYTGDITIPQNVTYSGVTYTVTSIKSYAFSICPSLVSVSMPNSIKEIGESAFCKSNNLKNVKLSENLKSLPDALFLDCESLISISIPSSVSLLGDAVFDGCASLTDVVIPPLVTIIPSAAFAKCYKLKSISIPESVLTIRFNSFNMCYSLESLYLSSVKSIENSAFCYCTSLSKVVLPNSLTNISAYAFAECRNLKNVISKIRNPFELDVAAFQLIPSDAVLTVPKGSLNLYLASESWSRYFNNIVEAEGSESYTLSIKATGNGSVSYNGTTIRRKTSSFSINEGTSATISFSPDNGYRIKSVLVNSSNVTSYVSNNTYTISNISRNTNVEVEFEAIPPTTYTLSIKATGNGSASFSGTTIRSRTTSFSVNEGTNATISFNPDNGYRIKSVVVNNSSVTSYLSNNQYTISSISRNTSVEVEFEAIPATTYTLSIKATGNGSASYNGTTIRSRTSSFNVNEGSSVTISLNPDNGYRIKSVKENSTNVTSYVSNGAYKINVISRNTSIEVEFEEIPPTTYTLTIKSTGCGYASYDGTSIRSRTSTFTVNEGTSATISFSPDTGYKIKSVKVNNSTVSLSNNQYTISNIQKDTSLEVEFEAITYTLTITSTGSGLALYDGTTIRNRTSSFTLNDGTSATISFSPDDGYRIKTVLVNSSNVTASISNNKYTISSISRNTSVEVEFEAIPIITYTLSIKATGNGSASYNGNTIRNSTGSFTVNEGTSATISLNPDNGYRVKSLKDGDTDVTSNVSNNMYIVSNIKKNTTIEVEFQEELKNYTSNGINYTVLSYNDKTINLARGDYGAVLEVPATITFQDITWNVAGVDDDALANNEELAAIIWNPTAPFNVNVSNPNLLLYVKSESYAPATIKNVVVNTTAENIVLTDSASGNNFYCPKEFTARKISYTHNYGMITGIDECRGWETIALPFDVKKIAHSSKGELIPFANWSSGDSKKPFWLMSYGTSGWTNANSIKANTPYIISMPNNPDYKAEFRLSGNITFSAENVTVKKSDALQTGNYSGNTFTPNFSNKANSGYLTLNVNNDYASYTGASAEGSIFVANLRPLHPFEAYMTSASKTRSSISINGDMTTGIEDMSVMMDDSKGLRIYNLKGQLIKVEQDKDIDDVKSSLPAGVYIVNGKKLIIK